MVTQVVTMTTEDNGGGMDNGDSTDEGDSQGGSRQWGWHRRQVWGDRHVPGAERRVEATAVRDVLRGHRRVHTICIPYGTS